jgi:hypothetical protein
VNETRVNDARFDHQGNKDHRPNRNRIAMHNHRWSFDKRLFALQRIHGPGKHSLRSRPHSSVKVTPVQPVYSSREWKLKGTLRRVLMTVNGKCEIEQKARKSLKLADLIDSDAIKSSGSWDSLIKALQINGEIKIIS